MVFFKEFKKEEIHAVIEEKKALVREEEALKEVYLKKIKQLEEAFEEKLRVKQKALNEMEQERAEKVKERITSFLPEGSVTFSFLSREDFFDIRLLHLNYSISLTIKGKSEHYEDALFVSYAKLCLFENFDHKDEAIAAMRAFQDRVHHELLKQTNNHLRALTDPNILLIKPLIAARVDLHSFDYRYIELKIKGASDDEISNALGMKKTKVKMCHTMAYKELF